MKFVKGDSAAYKLTTQRERSVTVEGQQKDNAEVKGGINNDLVELIYTQDIQDVNDNGYASAKITIKQIKCLSVYKDSKTIDFDSAKQAEPNNPLAKLVGQSYIIKLTPSGEVLNLPDTGKIMETITGNSPESKVAQNLIRPDAIKERHTIQALPVSSKNKLQSGNSWSITQNFSFDMMGTKTYEKVYTLKEVEKAGKQMAVVEMKAIPGASAEQRQQEQASSALSKMFDSTEKYTGRLELDLASGKIARYSENLQIDWLVVNPEAKNDGKEPSALKMIAIISYDLEKIN